MVHDEGGLPSSMMDSGGDRARQREGRSAGPRKRGGEGGCPLGLTVSRHAQRQAFLQAAVLAAVPARAVDGAVLLSGAGVGHVAVLAPAEEALGRADTRLLTPARPSPVPAPPARQPRPGSPRSRHRAPVSPLVLSVTAVCPAVTSPAQDKGPPVSSGLQEPGPGVEGRWALSSALRERVYMCALTLHPSQVITP